MLPVPTVKSRPTSSSQQRTSIVGGGARTSKCSASPVSSPYLRSPAQRTHSGSGSGSSIGVADLTAGSNGGGAAGITCAAWRTSSRFFTIPSPSGGGPESCVWCECVVLYSRNAGSSSPGTH